MPARLEDPSQNVYFCWWHSVFHHVRHVAFGSEGSATPFVKVLGPIAMAPKPKTRAKHAHKGTKQTKTHLPPKIHPHLKHVSTLDAYIQDALAQRWESEEPPRDKRAQRTCADHIQTMKEVLLFQMFHKGNPPTRSRSDAKEDRLAKRLERVTLCMKCGREELYWLDWSEKYAGPLGKYLLSKAARIWYGSRARSASSFRQNAAFDCCILCTHQEQMKESDKKLWSEALEFVKTHGNQWPQRSTTDKVEDSLHRRLLMYEFRRENRQHFCSRQD